MESVYRLHPREQQSIPIWVFLTKIPSVSWTLVGINWIASSIGKVLCFDESTERLERFEYAKVLVEVLCTKLLPDQICIQLAEGKVVHVKVEYAWRPDICDICKVFGHARSSCDKDMTVKNNEKEKSVVQSKEANILKTSTDQGNDRQNVGWKVGPSRQKKKGKAQVLT